MAVLRSSEFLASCSRFFLPGEGKKALVSVLGDGSEAFYLAQNGFSVEGVDPDIEHLKAIAWQAQKKGLFLKLIQADPDKIRLNKEKYDLIVCSGAETPFFILQIKKGVKSGGFILMESEINSRKFGKALFPFKDYLILKKGYSPFEGDLAKAFLLVQKPESSA